MQLVQVTVSGSVGKQVYKTSGNNTYSALLKGVVLTPSGANATVKIRDGNASGEVVFFARATSAHGSKDWKVCHKFTKGMHVTVIGSNAQAYLVIS